MINLAALLKLGLTGGLALAVISAVDSLGIPHDWQLLFNGFVAGWALHAWIGSYVGGMLPPDKNSTRGYAHRFRTLHLLFHRSTGYLEKAAGWELLASGSEAATEREGTES